MKVLIQNGADVNAIGSRHKDFALHYAAYWGHLDVVKVLIQNGADVNAVAFSEMDGTSLAAQEWTC